MKVLALITVLIVSTWCVQADELLARAERDVIIKWRTLQSALDASDQLQAYSADIEQVSPALPVDPREASGLERITTVRLTSRDDVADLIAALRDNPQVEYAEPRPIRYVDGYDGDNLRQRNSLDGAPDDPYYNMQWGLQQIEIENAWNITRGSPDVAIAVVDLGVWFGHPDLSGQSWENAVERSGITGFDDDGNGYVDDYSGYDFVSLDGDPTPDPLDPIESHGTHIAGIAAAKRNNGIGGAGVAPECRIMGVRAGSYPSIPYGYEGIYYACRAGARIINCSFGGSSESAYEHDVIDYVLSHGCVVVASAGNGGGVQPRFPAGIEGVISVAATGLGDQAAQFTERGPWVKVSAPGVAIVSTIWGENATPAYASWQGTSMAAPFVCGVLGLVASRFPGLTSGALSARVASSSDPIDSVNPAYAGMLGFGRINAWRAVADSVAGLRLGDITYTEISGNGDGRLQAGEVAELHISVFNDLTPVSNVYGQISTTEDTITLYATPSLYGDLPVGGPFWNSQPAFRVELPVESPRGRLLPLSIDWLDANQRLLGRATRVVYLDSAFVAVNNGRLTLGFAENGSLGYDDYERGYYIGPGLRLDPRPSNALYHGSFVLAADGSVSDNAYGEATRQLLDWAAVPDSVAHFVPSTRADLEARASFEDSHAGQMLFARVDAAALAWSDANANGFLILEYKVRNRSVNPWTTTYAGFFFDWDLGAAEGNISHYDSLSSIAYVNQVAPGHPLVGVVPLNDRWDTYYVIDNRAQIDSSGWTDPFKWQILSGGINQSPATPKDISQMVAVGPFSVVAHDSFTAVFAMVTGQNLDELRANALAAEAHYAARQAAPPPTAKVNVGLYPNPVTRGSTLSLVLPDASPATVRFYNILGRLVATVPVSATPAGAAKFRTDALKGATGLLFYRVESPAGNFSGKILILK